MRVETVNADDMYVGEFLLSVTAALQLSNVRCLKVDKLLFVELHSANKILFLKSIHLRIDEDDNTSTSHRGCALRRDPVPPSHVFVMLMVDDLRGAARSTSG